MSLVLNMVGGGAGGSLSSTDALLRVQAPAHSTVTITKGSTTKSDQGHENVDNPSVYDYYFIIHASQFDNVNPWIVTATLGSDIATANIIISTNDEYDVILSYRVPAEYQAVEYIESINTNQYLILVVDKTVPINTFSLDITFQETSSASGAQYIFGHQNYSPYFAAYVNASGTTLGARASAGNFNTATVSSAKTQARRLQYNGTAFSYDGTPVISDTSSSPLASNIALMGLATSNTVATGSNAMRIYEANIAIGSTTFDLIPCYRKSDSVIGFWDSTNNTFRQSDGSSPFSVVGPDM